ncbi:hypothetical protein C5167_044728 [Papaver somniferum]|nr:hypothetical protein C5167_044728 [Papaver somniferum]
MTKWTGFEYSEEEPEEKDIDIENENQYYNSELNFQNFFAGTFGTIFLGAEVSSIPNEHLKVFRKWCAPIELDMAEGNSIVKSVKEKHLVTSSSKILWDCHALRLMFSVHSGSHWMGKSFEVSLCI